MPSELGETAGGQIGTLQIVEPGTLTTSLVEVLQSGHIYPIIEPYGFLAVSPGHYTPKRDLLMSSPVVRLTVGW